MDVEKKEAPTGVEPPPKVWWVKIAIMLVVLVPFISLAFYFIYFWLHGVSIAR